jgi:hypothetical protein
MKKVLLLMLVFVLSISAFGQKKEMSQAFDANFKITSAKTLAKGTYECTASGEAGPYGRVYVTFNFTNKLDNEFGLGEFTGFGWSQTPDGITEATLQGVTKPVDGKFIAYSYDALTNGKIMQWKGEFDFVAGTIKLKVKEVQ